MLWINKKIDFDYPVMDYTKIIARLKRTPERISEMIKNLSEEQLKRKEGDSWSIQENIGHLINTEHLFIGRLDDFEAGKETLTPADMSNKRTNQSNYNEMSIDKVFTDFLDIREEFLVRLTNYPLEMFERSALHPRLNKPMRLVDSLYFEAEHDEHHIETIKEIIGTL